jgi:hypothetical protein
MHGGIGNFARLSHPLMPSACRNTGNLDRLRCAL